MGYIDKEAYKAKYLCTGWFDEISEEEFDAFSEADVVPVTRCEDCVHSFFDSQYNCRWCRKNWGRILVEDNDFCSYGKQKEGNKEAEEKFLSTLSPEGRKLYFKLIKGEL